MEDHSLDKKATLNKLVTAIKAM